MLSVFVEESELASECWVNISVKTDTGANKTFRRDAQTNNTQRDAPPLNSLTMANLSVMSAAYASIRKSFSPNAYCFRPIFLSCDIAIHWSHYRSLQEPFDHKVAAFLKRRREGNSGQEVTHCIKATGRLAQWRPTWNEFL